MRLFKIVSLASLIALSPAAAHAVDLLTVPTSGNDALPVADSGFDWNGFYAGVYGLGQASPVGGGQFGLGIDAGANARFEFVAAPGPPPPSRASARRASRSPIMPFSTARRVPGSRSADQPNPTFWPARGSSSRSRTMCQSMHAIFMVSRSLERIQRIRFRSAPTSTSSAPITSSGGVWRDCGRAHFVVMNQRVAL